MDIKFLTTDKVALDYFYPVPANKSLPEWYKKLPRYINKDQKTTSAFMGEQQNKIPQTIKACLPVQDYITSGYIIRASSDIAITPTDDSGVNSFGWSSSLTVCDIHPNVQCPVDINKEKNHYVKIRNSWIIKTPPGYSCYIYQPEFLFNENIRLWPGVVDTDTFPEPVNFVGVLTTKDSFVIKAGDPLMAVFPFKRQDWAHSVELTPEKSEVSILSRTFERAYQLFFHKPKNYG